MLTFDSMRKVIRVWHHVTPQDDGYGTEVKFTVDYDYFKLHSVPDFYEMICEKHCSPDEKYYNRNTELRNLAKALKNRELLKWNQAFTRERGLVYCRVDLFPCTQQKPDINLGLSSHVETVCQLVLSASANNWISVPEKEKAIETFKYYSLI